MLYCIFFFYVPLQEILTISCKNVIFILYLINIKQIRVQKENIADCMIIFLPNQYYTRNCT